MSTDESAAPMPRIHQVTLQVCNQLFLADGKCVYVADPIPLERARSKGWSPLLMYSISVEGLPLHSSLLCPLNAPRPIADVLQELWVRDPWLKGWPDQIKLSKAFYADAMTLVEKLQGVGMLVGEVPGRERSYEANRRAALDKQRYWRPFDASGVDRAIADVNTSLRAREDLHSQYRTPRSAKDEQRWAAWNGLDYRTPPPLLGTPSAVDWQPGDWLMLPFRSVAFGAQDRIRETGAEHVFQVESPDQSLLNEPEHEELLASWPDSMGKVAKEVDVSETQLRAFLRGRSTLNRGAVHMLNALLHLIWEFSDGVPYPRPMGPYLFTPKTSRAARRSWEARLVRG